MRSGVSVRGKPELTIDQAYEWVLRQACSEGRQESSTLRVKFSEGVAMEVDHITPTALASFFGVLSAVLLAVIGFLLRLLRLEKLRHRHELLEIGRSLDRTIHAVMPGQISPDGAAPAQMPPPPPPRRERTLTVRPTSRTTPAPIPMTPLPSIQEC